MIPIVSRICGRPDLLKWFARMRILVIQHDADKGLGVFIPPLVDAGLVLDTRMAGDDDIALADHAGVIALPGIANPVDRTVAVDSTRATLADALRRGVPIFGICLGAELLAEAAGGSTHPCAPEWGYREVALVATAGADELLGELPARFGVFQAHTYGFDLPPGAVALDGTPSGMQAFRLGDNAWGIQFHPEPTIEMLDGWTHALGDSMQAAGVDPAETRELARRYVPVWTEHAAAMGRRFAAVMRR
jgi:GMP synthase-like glutamine amidotransferase